PIFYVLAGMLEVGFIANLLVKPVADKYTMSDKELAEVRSIAHEKAAAAAVTNGNDHKESHPIVATVAWLLVGIPICYGVWNTVQKAWVLFH
ncbi:MAG: MFS transporter, partial [Methylophilales bacterium]|nr:MFS transporter [Methylophilales bacterium]